MVSSAFGDALDDELADAGGVGLAVADDGWADEATQLLTL